MEYIEIDDKKLLRIFKEIKLSVDPSKETCHLILSTGLDNRVREEVTAGFIILVAMEAQNPCGERLLKDIWKNKDITSIEINMFVAQGITMIASQLMRQAMEREERKRIQLSKGNKVR